MPEATTMRALAPMRPLRVICACETERVIEVADRHLDMPIVAYARALRCSACRRKGGKTFIGTIAAGPRPRPEGGSVRALFSDPRAHKRQGKPRDLIGLAFRIADREARERHEAVHGRLIVLSDDERQRLRLVRALMGWSNDVGDTKDGGA